MTTTATVMLTLVSTDILVRFRPLAAYDIGAYEVRLAGDINGDGHVHVKDLLTLAEGWGK